MKCPKCGSRSFKVAASYAATDYIRFYEGGGKYDFEVEDTRMFDGDWEDNPDYECCDCGHRCKEEDLVPEDDVPVRKE